MPSNVIMLAAALKEAKEGGKDLAIFKDSLFSALYRGLIGSHCALTTKVGLKLFEFSDIDQAADKLELIPRYRSALRRGVSSNSWSQIHTDKGYISIDYKADQVDLYVAEGKIVTSSDVEVLPVHWQFARYDSYRDTVLCEDLDYMIRRTFERIALNRSDYIKCGFTDIATVAKRRGRKSFKRASIIAAAQDLLSKQPKVSKAFYEETVRRWLNKEGLDPEKTAFHEHYGRLWTEHNERLNSGISIP